MSFVLLQNFLRKEIPCTASVNLSSIDTVKTPIKRALVDDSVFRIQYPVTQYWHCENPYKYNGPRLTILSPTCQIIAQGGFLTQLYCCSIAVVLVLVTLGQRIIAIGFLTQWVRNICYQTCSQYCYQTCTSWVRWLWCEAEEWGRLGSTNGGAGLSAAESGWERASFRILYKVPMCTIQPFIASHTLSNTHMKH